jgi:hypothetical protein
MSSASATESVRFYHPDAVEIGRADELDRLIVHCSLMGLKGRVELLRAVRAREIALLETMRDGIISCRMLERLTRPVMVLLGDDDYASTGPTGWAAARRLLYWASAAIVHASSANAETYRAAIALVVGHRRLLLVETDSAHVDEWSAAVLKRRIPLLRILPIDGVHPAAPPVLS